MASLKIVNITVGEQITAEQLIEERIIMMISKAMIMNIRITTKKYTAVMIRVCHSRSRFLSCMYIHDDVMTESR